MSPPSNVQLVGASTAHHRALVQLERVAASEAPVLVEGETGSGKEMVARAIHQGSQRSDKPFVALNCGAIPSELVDSELFGHEKGSFTGAIAQRIGRFELADRGTIFLDEVGEMTLEGQVKLLRIMEGSLGLGDAEAQTEWRRVDGAVAELAELLDVIEHATARRAVHRPKPAMMA
ncbi:MAG: sigma-54 factor interaction domain-containing protein [Sphingopyxis sp.]|nr:sigma-54 factor interaction domain-containing protein [Sphingopyxis sp.]